MNVKEFLNQDTLKDEAFTETELIDLILRGTPQQKRLGKEVRQKLKNSKAELKLPDYRYIPLINFSTNKTTVYID